MSDEMSPAFDATDDLRFFLASPLTPLTVQSADYIPSHPRPSNTSLASLHHPRLPHHRRIPRRALLPCSPTVHNYPAYPPLLVRYAEAR